MENIDLLIQKTKTMPNVSDGGSECFLFDDKVLVKYDISNEYGKARETEEEVFKLANEKNEKGVRTPKHLAIKRETDGTKNFCWVLQEKAKGVSFKNYCRQADAQIQLSRQKELTVLNDEYFKNLAKDIKELMYAGLELKPKNIFLDTSNIGGGFTIIDLLGSKRKLEYRGKLQENIKLFKLINSIFLQTRISPYSSATEEQKKSSDEFYFQCKMKCFKALEATIPEFKKHRRNIMRTMEEDELKYFKSHGYDEDLSLNEKEEKKLQTYCKEIVKVLFKSLLNGTSEYWDVSVNKVRIMIEDLGLLKEFQHSKKNHFSIGDFESDYEYESQIKKYLENQLLDRINEKIIDYVENNDKSKSVNLLKIYEQIKQNVIEV